jgi:hypothetical protein
MPLKLPQPAYYFHCFKIGTQVYLVIAETFYSFNLLQVKLVCSSRHLVYLELLQQRHSLLREGDRYSKLGCRGVN